MAQPSFNLIKYLGGQLVKKDTTITTTDLPAGINIVIFKTEKSKVSVNGTDAFTVKYGEMSYFDPLVVSTYIFNTDVEIAYGTVVEVTA